MLYPAKFTTFLFAVRLKGIKYVQHQLWMTSQPHTQTTPQPRILTSSPASLARYKMPFSSLSHTLIWWAYAFRSSLNICVSVLFHSQESPSEIHWNTETRKGTANKKKYIRERQEWWTGFDRCDAFFSRFPTVSASSCYSMVKSPQQWELCLCCHGWTKHPTTRHH